MKIGILTFHMAHNFGAMLQAYALSYAIEKISGCTCHIIDYRLPEIYDKYEKLLKMQVVEPKRFKFESFMKNDLPLSVNVMNLDALEKYDLYVLGGDQIWNPNITKGYKDEYFGICFPEDVYCISYAASTGINVDDWTCLAEKIVRINKIGVRETWCAKNLEDCMNRDIQFCLDPVLLIERTIWERMCYRKKREKYILIYSFDVLEKDYQEIENKAKEFNCNIIEIVTHVRSRREGVIYDLECGPKDFIGYVRDAEYIYTDSYHGVLFCLIYEKKFVYLSRGEKNDARVYDILKQLDLKKSKQGYYMIRQRNKDILQKYKKESLGFLKESILEVRTNETNV